MDPIRFLTAHGTLEHRPTSARDVPVVECALPHTVADGGSVIRWDGPAWRQGWAMVDTGADHCYIDDGLISKLGVAPKSPATIFGATATINGGVYSQPLFLIASRTICNMGILNAPLRANGRKFDIVIGRSLINQGHLLMDGFEHRYELHTRAAR